ncbi:hypothetical protein F5Y03DRAFT_151875 [Xylaria venustula]|nr:hypothetical protein F5Y03DRAFT_151875 [Xylaria venustula]
MPEYDYVRYTTSRPMRSQSFSQHHNARHTRPRCRENCACVSIDDWNDMVERERTARQTIEALTRDKRKKQLLQAEVDELRGIDKLQRRTIADLETELRKETKEKDHLDKRVREMSQTVSDQGDEIAQLEDEVERLRRAHKKDKRELGEQTERAREAWSVVSDLRRQLRDFHPFSFRPRYSFA